MIDFFDETPLSEPIIFDSHAHYDDEKFSDIRRELLETLPEKGVGRVLTCGCDLASSKRALALTEQYEYIYAAVGIHPECIENSCDISAIENLSAHKKCVAIGEIGLDYYWTQNNKAEQKELFQKQLILANQLDKPVIVHDRDAHSDTLELLKKHRPKGVLHSFSGSVEMAREILELGMYIGIGGVITFKNAKKLPSVVEMLPDDRILLETDAPYLTPVPYRSKINHSAMIYLTAQKIAEIRKTDTKSVLKLSFNNAQKLFGL